MDKSDVALIYFIIYSEAISDSFFSAKEIACALNASIESCGEFNASLTSANTNLILPFSYFSTLNSGKLVLELDCARLLMVKKIRISTE